MNEPRVHYSFETKSSGPRKLSCFTTCLNDRKGESPSFSVMEFLLLVRDCTRVCGVEEGVEAERAGRLLFQLCPGMYVASSVGLCSMA